MPFAVWHKSSTLEKPHNIGFEFIPPYTPEMNPIEQVWAEIRKRGFKNKAFKTLDDVIKQASRSNTRVRLVYFKTNC